MSRSNQPKFRVWGVATMARIRNRIDRHRDHDNLRRGVDMPPRHRHSAKWDRW